MRDRDGTQTRMPAKSRERARLSASCLLLLLGFVIGADKPARSRAASGTVSNSYRAFSLDVAAQGRLLRQAPLEYTAAARNTRVVVALPMPDGTFARFRVEESPVMAPALAARFPKIKTYRGRGLDDPTATARFDVTPAGFHAIVLSG